MATKLKIKMGHIEFEYEGEAPYDTESVKDLFTHLETLMVAAPAGAFDTPSPARPASAETAAEASFATELENLAPTTIAARLDAKTGPDLAIAAAAYLQICQGKQTFTRSDLRSAMQTATSFYTAQMNKNLTNIIRTIVLSKRVNSLEGGAMSLSAGEMSALRAKLAKS